MRTLILGLASRGLADEHVGLEVARTLHAMLKDPDVDIIEVPAAAADLFEVAAGYDKVVVVDSVQSGEGDFGELRRLGLADLDVMPRKGAASNREYHGRIELKGVRAAAVPLEIAIYAIELGEAMGVAEDVIRDAVPRLVAEIAREEFGARTPGVDWL